MRINQWMRFIWTSLWVYLRCTISQLRRLILRGSARLLPDSGTCTASDGSKRDSSYTTSHILPQWEFSSSASKTSKWALPDLGNRTIYVPMQRENMSNGCKFLWIWTRGGRNLLCLCSISKLSHKTKWKPSPRLAWLARDIWRWDHAPVIVTNLI